MKHVVLRCFEILLCLLLVRLSFAAPATRRTEELRTGVLPFTKHYAEFQISDGVGGNAAAEAAAVFFDPFEGVDLTAVPYDTYDWLALAQEAAEDAEIELFDPAIEDAVAEGDEWLADALEVGKTKNRVLYTTAAVQALKIRIAQNAANYVTDPDEESDWQQAQSDYQWIVNADRKNNGKTSMSAIDYEVS